MLKIRAVQRKLEEYITILSIIERPSTSDKSKKDYASCEKVCFHSTVRFTGINFRSGITYGALLLTEHLCAVGSLSEARETKVTDFQVEIIVEE